MKKVVSGLIFAASCLISVLVLGACGETDAHAHTYGEWKTVKEPTCTEEGLQTAVCTVCGEETEKKIAKTGHDFSGEPVETKKATCKEEGELEYTCRNGCGTTKKEPIEKTEHDFSGEETVTPATCTEKGERRVKCLYCDEVKRTVLSALNHAYDEGTIVKPATCEEEGERVYTCTREGCGNQKKETIGALGHLFGDFTVDWPSSLTEDGQKSRHCLHEGCKEVQDVTVLPKGENVTYTVKAVRGDGRDYPFPAELRVVLYDENNKQIGEPYPMKDGAAEFTVKDAAYRVKLEGLRRGYRQKTEPVLSRSAVDLKIELEASLVENDKEGAPTKLLGKGDPMYDFVVRDVNTDPADQKKLSELLKGKKGAYLYFFYVGCGSCSSQFPVFVEQYQAFGVEKDLLVLMINVYGTGRAGQSEQDMRTYKAKYPDEILMASGQLETTNIYDWVNRTYDGVPFGFFLDAEGVIDEIVPANSGAALRARYGEIFSRYFGERKETENGTPNAAFLPGEEKKTFLCAKKRSASCGKV